MSGPEVEDEERLWRVANISLVRRGAHPWCGLRMEGTIGRGFGRKKLVSGVAFSGKVFQCWAFAVLIDLKDLCLDSLATSLSSVSFEARAFWEDVWKSFGSVVSTRDYPGFALTEGDRRGVWTFRSVTRVLRCESNKFSS